MDGRSVPHLDLHHAWPQLEKLVAGEPHGYATALDVHREARYALRVDKPIIEDRLDTSPHLLRVVLGLDLVDAWMEPDHHA